MAMNTVPYLESTTETITQGDGTTKSALERLKSTGGAADINPKPGPKTQVRPRFIELDAVGTRSKAEFPSGANITELVLFATPATSAASKDGSYAIIAIDAASDAIADSLLTQTASSSDDAGWIPIPVGELVRIPLTDALSNGSLGGGRVDAKSVGGDALDLWIGGN